MHPPVGVDMPLKRPCHAMCSFCYAMMQQSQVRSSIHEHHALSLLDDFAETSARSVSFVDGETTPSKPYHPVNVALSKHFKWIQRIHQGLGENPLHVIFL